MVRSTDASVDPDSVEDAQGEARDELQRVVDTLRQFQNEEQTQALEESDERRRAWHDGRASAFHDAIERLNLLLPPSAAPTN